MKQAVDWHHLVDTLLGRVRAESHSLLRLLHIVLNRQILMPLRKASRDHRQLRTVHSHLLLLLVGHLCLCAASLAAHQPLWLSPHHTSSNGSEKNGR